MQKWFHLVVPAAGRQPQVARLHEVAGQRPALPGPVSASSSPCPARPGRWSAPASARFRPAWS
ncbi:hypothetical protein DXT57_04305 [Stenotrophomonas maltophilia]|nr:hypothetical protein DI494_03225 [Stenotrophomonas maltophilia]REC87780.1 hypothetical protein DXT57_04305 [Stenotrophomonas maltophilia]